MNKFQLAYIQHLAICNKAIEMRASHLDVTDEAILHHAAQPVNTSFELWGPLAPAGAKTRNANDAIIHWALYNVGGYCRVNEIASVLQTPYLCVDSQLMAHELKSFNSTEFYQPNAKFMRNQNFVALRQRLNMIGAATLADVRGLRCSVFVLNTKDCHWSLLVYFHKANSIAHFDSLSGMNEELAKAAYLLLTTLCIIPTGVEYVRRESPKDQRGLWECGYAVLATGFCLTERMREMVPGVTDPNEIITDNAKLRQMIRALELRSIEGREISNFNRLRLSMVYE